MSFHNDFNDFDEDVDDILLSDDETTKKSKGNLSVIKTDSEVPKDNDRNNPKTLSNGTSSIQINTNKVSKTKLFDDEHDPLEMIDMPKAINKSTKEPQKKAAKSVLESLLDPVYELDDFSFNKFIPPTKESNASPSLDNTIEKKLSNGDDFWQASSYRPSTEGPKIRDSNQKMDSKRTVRFSNDAVVDSELNSSISLQGRPVTAPSTNAEVAKSRFVSRFEEAELSDALPKHSDIKFNSESDPSLWRGTIADSSISSTKLKISDDDIEYRSKDGNNRTNPKQKLTEFLQTSNDDALSWPINKSHRSPIDLSGKSSIEELETLDDPYSNRRLNIQADQSFDKPMTSYGQSQSLNLDNGRRHSVQVDTMYERPRTGHGRSEGLELDYGRRPSVQTDTLFERPRTGHGRSDNSQIKSETNRNDRSDVDLRLKHCQSERDDLLYKLEGIIKRNKEENEIIERSYKNRLELMDENMQRKENRFKEEIDILSQQNKQKLQMLEDERIEMRAELSRRQDEIEEQKRNEISRIKEKHKMELDKLRLNHEDLLEKLHHAKSEEDATIRLAQPTTVQLQSVLAQVSSGAHDLASLKQQLLDQMNLQIREKDLELKRKNESLKELEEELNNQKHENIKEKERLQSLISKLDIQLKEQSRQSDEERWYLRQEQNKLTAMQSSLEKEREHILIEKDQNRSSQEEFRTKMLEEQKQMLDKLYDERRSLAEERTKITHEVTKWSESSQFSNIKKIQESAELEGMRAALIEERREIESIRTQLAKERDENIKKMSHINSLEYEHRSKSEMLHQLEMELSSKEAAIDRKVKNCHQLDSSGEENLKKAKEIQNSYQEQLSNIQKQLLVLAEREKQINKEQIELEKLRITIVSQDKASICLKCSNPLRDSAIGGSLNNIHKTSAHGLPKVPGSNKYDSYYCDQGFTNSIDYSDFVAGQMEEERLIHSIRRAADQDRDYLENERAYLRSIGSTTDQWWHNQVRS